MVVTADLLTEILKRLYANKILSKSRLAFYTPY